MLGLWEKDVQHLLMMTDCGISEEASEGEPARASLVREIYRFLDYHVSVVSKPRILFIRKCCNDFYADNRRGCHMYMHFALRFSETLCPGDHVRKFLSMAFSEKLSFGS